MNSSPRRLIPVRLALFASVVLLPLFGWLAGGCHDDGVPEVRRCSPESASAWTPDRIVISDLSTLEEIGEGSTVRLITGAQGSEMVGLELAVYGAAIPACIEAQLQLEGYFDEQGPLQLEVNTDGSGSALVYQLAPDTLPSRVVATVGDLSADFAVTVIR